ncbi:MAG TPA: acetyl-CoA carboxylase biotin carboxyl carrier protein [bacterium]|mgnify:CR=1 FL=1|nr:acetyl-CoA carboxylase biotin carboxyl carrier protein [bacterium]
MARAKKEASKPSKIDIVSLNEALKVMEKGTLVELLYEEKDLKIQLKKAGASFSVPAPAYIPQPALQAPAPAHEPAEAPKIEDNPNVVVIKSPMVGTFYRAPSPESPPFINIGDMIEPGKTLCIIEAMKIMNEIKSEVKGKVKEIITENAQAVEFNQPIIIVEKV